MATKSASRRSKRHDDERLAKLEWLLTFPMIATVGVLMICLLLPFMTDLSAAQQSLVKTVEWSTWVAFILEYTVRFFIASDKKRYIRQNILDLGVIAIPVLSLVIPWASFFFGVRVITAVLLVLDVGKDFRELFRARNVPYAAGALILVIVICGIMAFHVEHAVKDANITSVQDGIYWAYISATTTGYGDKFPLTLPGRVIASIDIGLGILFTGILTAAITAAFMKPTEEELAQEIEEDNERVSNVVQAQILAHLAPISDKLDQALALLGAHNIPVPAQLLPTLPDNSDTPEQTE